MKERTYNILMAACLALIYFLFLMSYWCDTLSGFTGFIYMTVSFIVFISLTLLREFLKRKGILGNSSDE